MKTVQTIKYNVMKRKRIKVRTGRVEWVTRSPKNEKNVLVSDHALPKVNVTSPFKSDVA